MPYYQGDYYRGGDNYYAAGGIFGSIGKLLGGVAKTVIGATPVGRVATTVLSAGKKLLGRGAVRSLATPAATVALTRLGTPSKSQLEAFGPEFPIDGGGGGAFGLRRKPRMNVTNVRALRRAGRRVRGFLKLARRFGALPISPKGKKLFKARRRK